MSPAAERDIRREARATQPNQHSSPAAIISQAARTLPHALRALPLADEQIAELSMLCGFDDQKQDQGQGQAAHPGPLDWTLVLVALADALPRIIAAFGL